MENANNTDSLKFNMTSEEFIERVNSVNAEIKKNNRNLPPELHEDIIEISGLNIPSKKLGAYDWELTFSDFKAVGQKRYMYKEVGKNSFTCKCAGLPADARASITTKEQFCIGKQFFKLQQTNVVGGKLLVENRLEINSLFRM